MIVAVNGIGNIGTTLLYLLIEYREKLGITELIGIKNTIYPWQEEDLQNLLNENISIVTTSNHARFQHVNSIENKINFIFDCTNNGGGMRNKAWYEKLPNLKGATAQGSEKSFGTSFMSNINNEIIKGEKYVHVVSCNTHAIGSLLRTFSNNKLENIENADFVIVRRSEDIGNHERLVAANVIARHLDPVKGTHHSIDVLDLFKTIDIDLPITSSDVTTPSQMMHGVRFNISLKSPIVDSIDELINLNPLISSTIKFDSNSIFERGRRLGKQGRIYSQSIIVSNNILLNANNIKGWAFIPQEGNTLLSTIHAFLLQTNNPNTEELFDVISSSLIKKRW